MNKTPLFSEANDVKMHIALLWHVALTDGKVLDSETTFIDNVVKIYASHLGIASDNDIMKAAKSAPENEIVLWKETLKQRPVQARNLIKDLITLAYVDNEFGEAEKYFIGGFASCLGVPNEDFRKMAEAIFQLMTATKTLEQLIFVADARVDD